jgi:hypothetical protein
MTLRIYLTGAAGAGVTTLGRALASALQLPHFDVDDYYWYPSDPPYTQARPPNERVSRLNQAFLAWVAGYETAAFAGRSRPRHEAWFAQLRPPSVRVDGSLPISNLLQQVQSRLS